MKNLRKAVVYILVALMLSGTALPVYAEELAEIEPAPVLASEPTTAPEATAEPEITPEPVVTPEPEVTSEPEVTAEPEVTPEPEAEPMALSLAEEATALDGDTGVVTLTAETIEMYIQTNGKYTLSAGSYKLGDDLDLSGSIQIQAGQDVTLDLAGYTLTSSAADVFSPAGTFTLMDSSDGQTGKIAFAANPNYSTRTAVNVNATGKFILQSGTIDTGFTYGVNIAGKAATFTMNGGTVSSPVRLYGGDVGNPSTMVANGGRVNAAVTISGFNTISGSGVMTEFTGLVTNSGTISAGTFSDAVTNDGTISGGQFTSTVTNDRTISGGTFSGAVTNGSKGTISDGTFSRDVTNNGTISGGSFTMNTTTLTNNGTISGGTFDKQLVNQTGGVVKGGTFNSTVTGIFTVSYDTDGGSDAPASQRLANAPATKPVDPVKMGYAFDGWYIGDSETKYTFSENEKINSDTTLKAKWLLITYTIDYKNVTDAELGVPTHDEYTIHSDTITLPTPARASVEGYTYTFLGWSGTGLSGSTNKNVTIPAGSTGNRVYTAHWQENESFTVIYDTGKDATSVADKTGVTGDTASLLPATPPSRTGYRLDGWKYGDTTVTNETKYSDLTSEATHIILTAVWEPVEYSISYQNVESGELGESAPTKYTIEGKVVLPTPSRVGYTFGGWYTASDCTGEAVETIAAGEHEDKTFYAKWTERDDFIVFFDTDGGSEVEPKTNVKWSDRVLTGVEKPTRDGYEFAGWVYDENTTTSKPVTTGTTYADLAGTAAPDDLVLRAKWKDLVAPVFHGLENGKHYCGAVSFMVSDNDAVESVVVDGNTLTPGPNNIYTLDAGLGEVSVAALDKDGNKVTVTITLEDGHFGGTATCSAKAKCACCGVEYGELDPTNHTLEHFIAVAPSEKAEGCIEHWFCSGCKKYFSDAEGKTEIDKADTVIAKLPASNTSAASGTRVPKTGDESMAALWLVLAAVSALGLGYVTVRKKKN